VGGKSLLKNVKIQPLGQIFDEKIRMLLFGQIELYCQHLYPAPLWVESACPAGLRGQQYLGNIFANFLHMNFALQCGVI
jgi:hypothetical protein